MADDLTTGAPPASPGAPAQEVRPPASLKAPPASARAPEPLRLLDLRAVLLALLVLAVGAALGAAGYTVERQHTTWLPQAVRTGGGWRVEDVHGRRFSGLSLSGRHLAWQDGPLILLMDLEGGGMRVLGPGPQNGSTWQPAASDEFVVWFEGRTGRARRGEAYAYGLSSRRRRALAPVVRPASYVAASGPRAVWPESVGKDGARLLVLDLSTGSTRSFASDPGEPLVDGGLVALKVGRAAGDAIDAVELAGGRRWPVVGSAGGPIAGFGLSGRRVAWSAGDAATGAGRVLVRDVDTGATTLVGQGAGLAGPAIYGDVVVWAQTTASGGGEIVGRRLGGGPAFTVAAVNGRVESLQVSGDTVAWLLLEPGGHSAIQTARLPR